MFWLKGLCIYEEKSKKQHKKYIIKNIDNNCINISNNIYKGCIG